MDVIDLHPQPSPKTKRRMLIFFMTGNPGLIEYYRVFLTRLYDTLRVQDPKNDLHIYGASLAGFEISEPIAARSRQPYDLDQEIDTTALRLLDTVKRINKGANDAEGPLPVVLVGHSVGAYMLLEIMARWQAMPKTAEAKQMMDIVGGICLFPTVVDIAKSPSGEKMAAVLKLPGFALIVHLIAKVFLALVPFILLVFLVRIITFMPSDAARTTAAFIKSKHGVRQALYMAKHEMIQLTDDKWSTELWGADPLQEVASAAMGVGAVTPPARPKLHFYWGQNDHWVARSTRNELIRTRGRTRGGRRGSLGEGSKPLMEIDRNGVPHGFCIRHSVPIADKVAEYVTEIADGLW
ncbi:hypothetical protein LTR08_005972 [Meristemomyces frigidus]|nr:hypothetical protein LTR08_005972 [Meristemomyces frigidus]